MKTSTTKKFVPSVVLASILTIGGCATYDPYTGEEKPSNATIGSVVGAVAGAAIGAATSSKGDRKKGILIGAAAGAAAGGGAGYYMDKQEAKLRHQLKGTGVGVKRVGDEITLVMPGNITFEVNRYTILEDFQPILTSIATVLKEFDETAIEVTGHTDSTGSESYNQTLSEQRANAVKTELINRTIPSGRIHASGMGMRAPIASNKTAEGRQQNRRVELKLLPLKS